MLLGNFIHHFWVVNTFVFMFKFLYFWKSIYFWRCNVTAYKRLNNFNRCLWVCWFKLNLEIARAIFSVKFLDNRRIVWVDLGIELLVWSFTSKKRNASIIRVYDRSVFDWVAWFFELELLHNIIFKIIWL